MRIDWDVPITMDDGLVLRADVFRPVKPRPLSRDPELRPLRQGPRLPGRLSERLAAHGRRSIPTSRRARRNRYQNWEVVDPEKWVPHDYVCVRVDSRGCGCSPGFIDHFSPRETKDFYDCIEWAGVQPWSNGKVGLNGISYYGINQWHVASLQPPHLAAMCIWEGAADWYRDMTHHGGILCTFWANWYDMQVKTVQYGAGERGKRSRVHGELVCGPRGSVGRRAGAGTAAISATRSASIRSTTTITRRARRSGRRSRCRCSGRQLGRPGPAPARQLRGLRARRLQAEVAGGARHRALDALLHRLRPRAAAALLRSFPARQEERLGQAAEGAPAGAPSSTASSSVPRGEWPIARTKWTKLYLDPVAGALGQEAAAARRRCSFAAMGDGVTFLTAPLDGRDRDHRPVGAEAVRVLLDHAMPTCS